jgi:hypothetical protein
MKNGTRDLVLKLTGTRPLIMHNGRLSNPLDEYTQAVAAISKKRNKTLEDYRELAQLEMRGGMYETPGGMLGFPAENVWKSIREGATAYKLGRDVDRALRFDPDICLLHTPEGPVSCEEYMQRREALYYVPVVISGRRTMRARPKVASGWTAEVGFRLDESVLPLSRLRPCLARAGEYVGVGERRPAYGRYTVGKV